ncbi:MAG: aminoglycoside phosphotransferase family protein [Planctomycetota bacterium]
MLSPDPLVMLCRRWCAEAPVEIQPLGIPGFSGSQVFRIERCDTGEQFVLKSFPASASVEHALWVHHLVRHLRAEGMREVPEVMDPLVGDTVVADASGGLWELTRLMPGVAVPRPTPLQAAAAAARLARFHLAASRLPADPSCEGFSPGLKRRIAQARDLRDLPWRVRRGRLSRTSDSRFHEQFTAALTARFDAAIEIFAAAGGPALIANFATMNPVCSVLQAVLRDVWCDHVLFADYDAADVTAIIDLHAAGVDTPATDLARLLGSWAAPAGREQLTLFDRWPEAIVAYTQIRPLSAEERGLIPLLHTTGVILGLDNWFRWTLEERREFSDASRVLARIDSLLQELQPAVASLSAGAKMIGLKNVD